MSERRSYPDEWKALCLTLLKAYAEQERISHGWTRVGWQRIRDWIMEPHDSVENGGRERSPLLTRQDLENWERGGEIGSTKFRYVDEFIHRREMSDLGLAAMDEIKRRQDEAVMATLSDLYVPLGSELADRISRTPAPFWRKSKKLRGSWFEHLAIGLRFSHRGVFKIIVAYMGVKKAPYQDDSGFHTIFFDGFFVPLENSHPTPEKGFPDFHLSGKLLLIRPQYRGDPHRGYADGEMAVGDVDKGQSIVHHASPAVAPRLFGTYTYPVVDEENVVDFDRTDAFVQVKLNQAMLASLFLLPPTEDEIENLEYLLKTQYKGYVY